ncbi:hypothetical protein DCC39_06815 [Pueribacillus theae]|uniref:Uncharacterized protein n=1 Tax=Pueribacillus theae TaxID=2171751 RepID=A0A2U1K5Q8_9BACI|nr:hypothetical protein DCC39_06815 [Pueribacillus theae]
MITWMIKKEPKAILTLCSFFPAKDLQSMKFFGEEMLIFRWLHPRVLISELICLLASTNED